ncbi:SRPBCC family protein [Maricaulis parjimensis]|uniref:SRPBCC family protein n=1 Tax=Maricaulis parjimensis TaxID=144023 RepID=UPI001939441D|nr:SRPBCC domain-containing protein [Maricaulis parjimensis]
MTSEAIEKSVLLKAPPARVWAFLTEPDLLGRWFHPSDRALTEPGPYVFWKNAETEGQRHCWGEVLEVEPGRRLVYTFTHEWLGGHPTRVEWSLEAVGEGTRLRLVHDGFAGAPVDSFDSLFGHDEGWGEHLTTLRNRVGVPETVA